MLAANGWCRLDKCNVKGTFNGADREAPVQMNC
jgi:hypothetical protein